MVSELEERRNDPRYSDTRQLAVSLNNASVPLAIQYDFSVPQFRVVHLAVALEKGDVVMVAFELQSATW
ncbi:hypothetical protein HYFRA_00004215 [Hymenoscyphus fraxineus]|uniref:Uncharacterized protein n=1 Tax=Hymenoscyphus fraxineus TaxID=746836 RepID=A0A9N9KQS6_9HELO|nr:hypothetical protein HYFRA_00004215 [Hymenoscyphus fraxineus]